jgi:hypothetical protein
LRRETLETFGSGSLSGSSFFVGLSVGFLALLGALVGSSDFVAVGLVVETLVGEKNLKTAQAPTTRMSTRASATTTFEGL